MNLLRLFLRFQKQSCTYFFTFFSLQRFHLNGVIGKLKNKYIKNNLSQNITYGIVELSDITPTLTLVVGSMILAILILIIEKVYYSFKTRSKNNELKTIKKLNYNLGVRNKLQKGNNERNLKHQRFSNTRLIGYWP